MASIFESAKMSMLEIAQMATDPEILRQLESPLGASPYYGAQLITLGELKRAWAAFIDSLLNEWTTLNVVSVLLLSCAYWNLVRSILVETPAFSAILTILQIPSAANDPVARHTALLSLICALMSVLYGCMFIIRFANMKGPRKALVWAEVHFFLFQCFTRR